MQPAASIIISNYNYGQFLRAAIDSSLAQANAQVEIIVVDDGSSDDSRQIIESYDGRITSIFQSNGGQASAFNAGFARSCGRVVMFLDADDVLLPHAIARASAALAEPGVAKVHWPLRVIDASGSARPRLHPNTPLPDGDYLQSLIEEGPWMCEAPPTSGNAFSRRVLEKTFPIPPVQYRICADAYLLTAAPLFGTIRRIDEPLSCYRLHDRNNYWNQPFAEALRRGAATYELQCRTASQMLAARSIAHDPAEWYRYSWWHRLRDAVRDICTIVPDGESFILADEDQWGTPDVLNGRQRIPFPQVNGSYSGPPADERAALKALEQSGEAGAGFVVFGWPAFWYLEHFPALRDYLRNQASSVLQNDRIMIFQLRLQQ